MRHALIALAATAQAAVLAMPAMAQPPGPGRDTDKALAARTLDLRHHVAADREDDLITRPQAYNLSNELDRIDDLGARYRAGGFTVAERDDIIARQARVQANLSQALAEASDSRSLY